MQLFCFLTEMEKQYGTTGKHICNEPMYAYEAVWQVQSGHPVFSGGPPETEEKVLALIMGAYAERRCASVN